MFMMYTSNYGCSIQLKIISMFISILMIAFSCSKKEVLEPVESIEIQTGLPLNLEPYRITLTGKVIHLESKEILDHGFLLSILNSDSSPESEQTISLGKNITIGEVMHDYVYPEGFKQNAKYTYRFYIRTSKAFYIGNHSFFTLDNITIPNPPKIYSYETDTITVHGEFDGLDDRYWLCATTQSGSFSFANIPFQISPDKKSLTFILTAHPRVRAGETVEISLVRVAEYPMEFKKVVAHVEYLPKLFPPPARLYSIYEHIPFPRNRVAAEAEKISDLWYLINGYKIPYGNGTMILFQHKFLSGNKLKIGYMNKKDSVYFDNPLEIKSPTNLNFEILTPNLHTNSLVKIKSLDAGEYFSEISQTKAKIAGKEFPVSYDKNISTYEFYINNIPDGEYDIEITNDYYSVMIPGKIHVQQFAWSEVNVYDTYLGDPITVIGNFITGHHYEVYNQENQTIGNYDGQDGKLIISINWMFRGIEHLKIGYFSYNPDRIPFKTIPDNHFKLDYKGVKLDRFYPLTGSSGDVLTMEGKGIGLVQGYVFGDKRIYPVSISKDKVTFSIPHFTEKGKLKIGYILQGETHYFKELFNYNL